jgi:AcrR family transcriptional regulator
MPPQLSFTNEEILNAAFEIVRKEGWGALSARRIAQELNCSTHPIYRAFQSMSELETALIEKAKAYVRSYLLTRDDETKEPFLNIGLRYLRFAKEEKELFKLLFMSGKVAVDLETSDYPAVVFLERMKQDPHLQRLDDKRLRQIFMEMWIFTHGLTTLVSVNSLKNPDKFMAEYLERMGETVIRWELEQASEIEGNRQYMGNKGVINQ